MTATSPPIRAHILERSVKLRRQRSAFALLATVQVTLILAITVIAIALPAVQRDLDLRPGELALVSAGYGLSFSGLLLLGGRLADLLGPRRLLVVGLAAFGMASTAAGLAPGFAALLATRLAQGVGAALAAPAAMALLGSVFPERDRHARALAMWGGLAPLGATGGILLSGVAVTWASWRWGFALPAAVAAVAALAAPRLLPEGVRADRSRLDLPGALLVTAGAGALAYGVASAGDRGWSSAGALVGLAGSAVALGGFVAVERRAPAPLVPLRFFRSGRRVTALAAVLLAASGHAAIAFFLALYFQQVRDMSPLVTSAAFLPFALPLAATGLVAGRLVGRHGAATVAAAGLGLGAAGLLLLGRLGVDTPYAGTVLAGLVLFPVGAALTFSAATVAAVEGAGASERGLAGGVVNTAVELGASVGLAVLVSVARTRTAGRLEAGDDPAAATTSGYALALTAAAVAFALAAALVARGRRRAAEPSPAVSDPPIRGENR